MKNSHVAALIEDFDSKLDTIIEGQAAMATSVQLQAIDDRLTNVEADVQTIKTVVTETNRDLRLQTQQLNNHEIRITSLEDEDKLKNA